MRLDNKSNILSENIFETNVFEEDNNVFSNKLEFTFKNCKKSVNFPKYKFTNFFKNRKELYKFIKRECNNLKQTNEINAEYLTDNYQIRPFGGKRMELLHEIIETNVGERLIVTNVKRLRNNNNKEVQFLYRELGDGTIDILAIDLYHLLMTANDKQNPEKKNDGIKQYETNKNNSIDLSEILKNL